MRVTTARSLARSVCTFLKGARRRLFPTSTIIIILVFDRVKSHFGLFSGQRETRGRGENAFRFSSVILYETVYKFSGFFFSSSFLLSNFTQFEFKSRRLDSNITRTYGVFFFLVGSVRD